MRQLALPAPSSYLSLRGEGIRRRRKREREEGREDRNEEGEKRRPNYFFSCPGGTLSVRLPGFASGSLQILDVHFP